VRVGSELEQENSKAASLAPKDESQRVNNRLQVLDAPLSWCAPLVIERQDFFARYPEGQKMETYHKCIVGYFSDSFHASDTSTRPENHNLTQVTAAAASAVLGSAATRRISMESEDTEDTIEQSLSFSKDSKQKGGSLVGLVKRVTVFEDTQRTIIKETTEYFESRRDKLTSRQTIPSQCLVREQFAQGRTRGLLSFTEIAGVKRIFEFYPHARVDGMIKREEIIGVKIIELYENRDDRLTYRSVAFDSSGYSKGSGAPLRRANRGFVISTSPNMTEISVRKITEKFARDEAVPAAENVRKRTHFLTEGRIRLDFHYGAEQITSSQLLFDKNSESCQGHHMIPHWKPPSTSSVREQLQMLLSVEKQLMSKVKDRERDMQELLLGLHREKQIVVLHKSIYDIAFEQARDQISSVTKSSEKPMAHTTETKFGSKDRHVDYHDYLVPFLNSYQAGKPFSRKQALQIKEECLKALKERLLERANIIQAHLDSENEFVRARLLAHEKRVAELTAVVQAGNLQEAGSASAEEATAELGKEKEDFAKFHEEATFRIGILQARLARHEEQSLQKYSQLDAKLWSDPRLRLWDKGAKE